MFLKIHKTFNNRPTRIKIARNSVFDCHLSTFVDSINVFDCRLSCVYTPVLLTSVILPESVLAQIGWSGQNVV